MSEWISIFRTGTHTDMAGNIKEWTEHDLDTIVAKYDPAEHSAPEVIGHPEHNSPAWGWVEGLKREGQLLYMKAKDRAPEFVEMLKKGLFRKRSISLYPDLTLRHVGWLGATPPAVKGLPDVAFGEAEEGVMEFTLNCNKGCRKTGCNIFTEKEGDMPGEKEEAQAKIELEVEKRLAAERKKIEAQFAEAQAEKAKSAEFAEAQKKKEADIAAREKALADREKALKCDEIKSFCEGLLKEGKLTPAMVKHGLVNFMETLSEQKAGPMQFAEGAAKQTPLEFMKTFLSGFGKQIEFSEVATRDKDVKKGGNAAEKLGELTKQKMHERKDLSYNQAFAEVQIENRELALEYAEELRA